jgi:hypothetical protein
MKQETLEEFIKVELEDYDERDFSTYERFITLGAKWQAKRMYSEEEVKHIVSEALQSALVTIYLEQWFKQFKKK